MMERISHFCWPAPSWLPGRSSEPALNNDGKRQAASKLPKELPLPPIPYLDTLPWMNFGSQSKGPGVDILWLPTSILRRFRKSCRPPTVVSGMLKSKGQQPDNERAQAIAQAAPQLVSVAVPCILSDTETGQHSRHWPHQNARMCIA
jgi:hypothetical protein